MTGFHACGPASARAGLTRLRWTAGSRNEPRRAYAERSLNSPLRRDRLTPSNTQAGRSRPRGSTVEQFSSSVTRSGRRVHVPVVRGPDGPGDHTVMKQLPDPDLIRAKLDVPPEGPVPRYIAGRHLRRALGVSRGKLKAIASTGVLGDPIRLTDSPTADYHYSVDSVLAWLRAREMQSRAGNHLARALAQKLLR